MGTCMVWGVAVLRNWRTRLPGLSIVPSKCTAGIFPCMPGALRGLIVVLGQFLRACPAPCYAILIRDLLQRCDSPCKILSIESAPIPDLDPWQHAHGNKEVLQLLPL